MLTWSFWKGAVGGKLENYAGPWQVGQFRTHLADGELVLDQERGQCVTEMKLTRGGWRKGFCNNPDVRY